LLVLLEGGRKQRIGSLEVLRGDPSGGSANEAPALF
jgi:hypothetical protein